MIFIARIKIYDDKFLKLSLDKNAGPLDDNCIIISFRAIFLK